MIIPTDRPDLLKNAEVGDKILKFIKPLKELPPPWDSEFRALLRRLDGHMGIIIPFPTRTGTVYARKLGGGIEGRSNLNAMLKPQGMRIERPEPFIAVKWYEVVEVIL